METTTKQRRIPPYIRDAYSFLHTEELSFDNVEEALDLLLFPYQPPVFNNSYIYNNLTSLVVDFENIPASFKFEAQVHEKSETIQNVYVIENNATSVDELDRSDGSWSGSGGLVYGDFLSNELVARLTAHETSTTHVDRYFKMRAYDGINNVDSTNRYVYLVYPYFYGVGAASLDGGEIYSGLTRSVEREGNKTKTFSPSSQKIYFCYPAEYGDLSQIKDQNNFDVTSSFTKRVETLPFTNGAGNINYNVYESNDLVTQSGFGITFYA